MQRENESVNPYAYIIDDFLPDFPAVREWADGAEYCDIVNDADGVTYPHIAMAPDWICEALRRSLAAVIGPVLFGQVFARMSPKGVPVPHPAHNDAAMGQWSLMLYLNRSEHCRGGTSLLRHESGFETVTTDVEQEMARECANMPQCWSTSLACPMKPNRALIFPAGLMHRAEPVGGFGKSARDARLVLTAFFNEAA